MSSYPTPLSGQKYRFIPIYRPVVVTVSEAADAPHYLRISDIFGTNRTYNEGLLACPRDDLQALTNPTNICGNWRVLGI